MSWHDARAIAVEAPSPLPSELVALADSVGRRLARELISTINIPHFASSAMDGWLTVGEGPWRLTDARPAAGEARVIVTGGMVAESGASVLRSESGSVIDGMLRSTHPDEPRPGQHIRDIATEARRGESLIAVGRVLNPAHLALAAGAGVDDLCVQAEPGIALILTGDEVVERGTPEPGHVRDSFGVQLPELLRLLGGRVRCVARARDTVDDTVLAIYESTEPLIITTGGTGSSSADFVRPALKQLEANTLVDGVAMRPGGPTTLAQLPDGRMVACLPGNPLAAMIVAITICEPLIAGLAGRTARPTREIRGIEIAGRSGSTLIKPYSVIDGLVALTPWQGSAMMRGLTDAVGLLVVPEHGIEAGMPVECVDLPWLP